MFQTRLRILVDFTQIPLKRTGAGVYAENLVSELPPLLRPGDQLFVLLQSDELILPKLLAGADNVQLLTVSSRFFRNRPALMFFEQLVLPGILFTHQIDVLHSLHYTSPLWAPAARVVTFHDLTMLLWPQLHTWSRRVIMPLYMRQAWKNADAILFVSQSTQRDAERIFGASGRFRAVTPLGVSQDAFTRPSTNEVREELAGLKLRQPYLLFVGTIEPRKNLVRLIHAFEKFAGEIPNCTLVLAGKLGWDYEPVIRAMAESPFRERIRHLGYIADQTRRILLAGCSALVYPSLYEGFGLPVLEGMAAGVPVITSNISSLPEVAGDAALLVNPESVEELAGALRTVLSSAVAEVLSESGQQRAQLFTWKRTAAETWKAYLAACQQTRGLPPAPE